MVHAAKVLGKGSGWVRNQSRSKSRYAGVREIERSTTVLISQSQIYNFQEH